MLVRLLVYLASSFRSTLSESTRKIRDPSAQCKLQKSFAKHITIYSNNYLSGGS